MINKKISYLMGLFALVGMLGFGIGSSETATAQSWPNQCYNSDGGQSCPICGGSCLGGNYLCCNNGVE